jgi:hypothetical protein
MTKTTNAVTLRLLNQIKGKTILDARFLSSENSLELDFTDGSSIELLPIDGAHGVFLGATFMQDDDRCDDQVLLR